MLFLGIDFNTGVYLQFDQLAIHADPHKTFTSQFFDHITKLTFLMTDDGCQQHQSGPLRQIEQTINNLRWSL